MSLSSDDEDVITRRRSAAKNVFDSDDEVDSSPNDPPSGTEGEQLTVSHPLKSEGRLKTPEFEYHSDKEGNTLRGVEGAKNSDDNDSDSDLTSSSVADQSSSRRGDRIDTRESEAHNTPSSEVHDIRAKLSALADSDSESDNDEPSNIRGDENVLKVEAFDSVSKSKHSGDNKSKSRSERKSKTVAKDAMLEIKAESQRRLRESNIGLPYHIPKERTLADFLNRRRTSSMPIKGPADTLIHAWRQIEEREKEAEEFYKSESESDSDAESNIAKDGADVSHADTEASCVLNKESDNSSLNVVPSKLISADSGIADSSIVCNDSVSSKNYNSFNDNIEQDPVINSVSSELNNMSETEKPNTCEPDQTFLKKAPIELHSQNIQLQLSEAEVVHTCTQDGDHSGTIELRNVCVSNEETEGEDPPEKECGTLNVCVSNDKTEAEDPPEKECGTLREKSAGKESKSISTKEEGANGMNSEDFVLAVGDSETWGRSDSDLKTNKCAGQDDGHEKHSASNAFWEKHGFDMTDSEDESEVPMAESTTEIQAPEALKSIPRLSLKGTPNEIIDLDEIGPIQPKQVGVHNLMERFMRHSITKAKPSSPQIVELSVIASEKGTGGDIIDVSHESIKVSICSGEESPCQDLKPGAKLKLLKDELFRQMKKQKEEEWQKKQEELQMKQQNDEKDDCGGLPFDEEEEEDLTETETESEPEINDIREPKKRKRKKNEFFDEEAEVEDSDGAGGGSASESENEEGIEEEEEEKEEGGDHSNPIVDEEQLSSDNHQGMKSNSRSTMQRSTTSTDLFASQSSLITQGCDADDYDELVPPGQPKVFSMEQEESFSCSPSPSNFSLSELRTDSEETAANKVSRKFPLSKESISVKGLDSLFLGMDVLSTQDKMNELVGLCSGKFDDSVSAISQMPSQERRAIESEHAALSSGKFVSQDTSSLSSAENPTSTPSCARPQAISASETRPQLTEDSQNFILTWNADTANGFSEPADVEEPSKPYELEIATSDEEDVAPQKEVRKKSRKLEFSDDEDNDSVIDHSPDEKLSNDDEADDEEADDQLEETAVSTAIPGREVMYDSDENEIEPAQFFENEAELSDEEWEGSEDEDEAGLDQIEMNEADKEDIDQDKVREDIVKSHMQKMLDEDRRDVRILQEMLLEDGELHSEGGGRERQFRWKNVDMTGMTNDVQNSDDEIEDKEEDEEDAEWRKKRYEREMFLKQQQEQKKAQVTSNNVEEDEILYDSELLQLGKAVLHKSRNNSMEFAAKEPLVAIPTAPNPSTSPDGKRPFQMFAKRGSFLSRSDGVLAKLAKIMGSAKENVSTGAKTSGNFVFAAISPPKADVALKASEEPEVKGMKRKATKSFENHTDKKPCLPSTRRKGSGLFEHI